MVKYKGNKNYKPIKVWSKTGRQKTVYIPNQNIYEFEVDQGKGFGGKARLTVMAYNKQGAIKQAKSWAKNLKRNLKKYHGITKKRPVPKVKFIKLLHRRVVI